MRTKRSKNNYQLKKWIGLFGKNYTDRNMMSLTTTDDLYRDRYGIKRTELNMLFLKGIDRTARILEVGSNVGTQLLLLQKMGFKNLYGIEPQEYAVRISKKRTTNINIICGNVFEMPFQDNFFHLVFTSGVLIHISPKTTKKAMKEIYRCSNRYIWGLEYYAKTYTNIPYRGYKNLLWKADFAKIYCQIFKNIKLVKKKMLKYVDSNLMDSMFLLKKQR